MLSRNLKRALLDSRWPLPPPFLLPWTANLTTVSHSADPPSTPPSLPKRFAAKPKPEPRKADLPNQHTTLANDSDTRPALPSPNSPTSSTATPLDLSPSLRELLPLLKAQGPHYITAHVHGKPYLLTQGDTVRLPFLMHGVEPGDILRLNRAVIIGSRDYTLKASASAPRLKSTTTDTRNVLDPTTGSAASMSQVMPSPSLSDGGGTITPAAVGHVQHAPHFIPHIEQGKHSYIDERLFVCRAVVVGVESEPMRIKEKTKRRQRKVKRVKSKHRFTVLRVKEVRVRSAEELDEGVLD